MSSTLQLVKAPLLVLAASVIHFATTPPHPPAAPTEQVKSNFLEDFLRVSSPRGIVHFSLWAGALVEVASIFLMTYPPPPKSLLYPLSQLLRTENPRGIRVTIPFLLGVFLSCSGAYLRWACYRALGRFFTFEMSLKKDHRLIKDGPYSFVRHPGYLAILVTITGGFLTFASPGSWIWESGFLKTRFGKPLFVVLSMVPLVITASLIDRLPREDEVLHNAFGEEWELWAKEVPYKLLPYIW